MKQKIAFFRLSFMISSTMFLSLVSLLFATFYYAHSILFFSLSLRISRYILFVTNEQNTYSLYIILHRSHFSRCIYIDSIDVLFLFCLIFNYPTQLAKASKTDSVVASHFDQRRGTNNTTFETSSYHFDFPIY